MKTKTKRRLITICLVLFIIASILTTILITNIGNVAAADLPTTMRIDISDNLGGKSVAKGGTFKLLMTVTYLGSDAASTTWSSLDLTVGPLLPDLKGFDKAIAKKLKLTPYDDVENEKNPQSFLAKTNLYFHDQNGYGDSGSADFLSSEYTDATRSLYNGSFRLSIKSQNAGGAVGAKKQKQASDPVTFEIEFTVADDIEAESITFGFWKTANSEGKYTPTNNIGMGEDTKSHGVMQGEKTKGMIAVNEWTVNIMNDAADNTIAELEMGPSADNLAPVDLENMKYVINGPDDKIFIKPTLSSENATAKVGLSDGTPGYKPTDAVTSGEVKQLPMPTGNGKIVIEVTAKNGDVETYEIEVVIAYVRLGNIEVDAGDPSLPTLGLVETFDKDTFSYTANVKPSSTIQMTATVLDGYGINTALDVSGTGCTAGATATSGTAFSVADITDGATVTITATASDGITKQAYVVSFIALSDDATIKSFTVVGAVDTYNSDAAKATENTVDYYFYLMNETVFEGAMKITVADGATILVDGAAYDENKMQPLGEYTVKVIAAAGNDATYKVIIAAPEMLEFIFECGYDFIFEEEDGAYYYRRSYAEKGLVHGVDDKDWERYVLGQIAPLTTINTFLGQIKENLLSLVKIFTDLDVLVYDRGSLAADYADKADSELYGVSTGWRVEFGAGDTPTEIIYLSILGDVDGNGIIDASDSTRINQHIQGKKPFDILEFRLAAYVYNGGSVSALDNTEIGKVIKGKSTIDSYYWKPEAAE